MNIVVIDGHTLNPGDNPWTGLDALGPVTIYPRSTADETVGRCQDAGIVITNKVRFHREALDHLPKLRFIAVCATGYDCVDVKLAKEKGIPVSNVPEYGTDTVAQFTLALLLHCCHDVGGHARAVQAGDWTRQPDFSFTHFTTMDLAGQTLGLIGVGRIGGRVAELAQAFGMRVITLDRGKPTNGITAVSLNQLLHQADFISLHCPLTESNKGLVNREFLGQMKPTARLINTSRGGLVVEADLAAALNAGQIAGAALDVVSVEPIRTDNPLLHAKNCVITPHMAWASLAARRRLMSTTIDNIRAFRDGTPQHVVNR